MEILNTAKEFLAKNTIPFLQNLIVSIIIIFIGLIIARTTKKILQRILNEIELNNIIKKININLNIEKTINVIIYYTIILLTIIMALNQLGLSTTILNIMIFSILILGIFLIIIYLKYYIPNAFAKMILNRKINFKKGDYIKINWLNMEGKVDKITAVETKIITKNKDEIYIPNSSIFKTKISVIKNKI